MARSPAQALPPLGESTEPANGWLLSSRKPRVSAGLPVHQTADGRILKLLRIVDEFTREALDVLCKRRIDADSTAATLERLVPSAARPSTLAATTDL